MASRPNRVHGEMRLSVGMCGSARATFARREHERVTSARRIGDSLPQATYEIDLNEADARSLGYAIAALRWLLSWTNKGWSHAALDPAACRRTLERLREIHNEAAAQLKSARMAIVSMSEADAFLLQEFAAMAEVLEPGAFSRIVREVRAIAAAVGAAKWQPPLRERRSSLAEPSPRSSR